MTALQADDFFKVKQRIIENAWIKTFSLYIQPTLSLENLGYNSNIYSYREISEPDWTADAGVNINIAAILKNRFILMIDEFPYYSFYAKNKNEEALNNKFQFSLYTHLGRFNLNYRLNRNSIRGRSSSEFGPRTRRRENNHEFTLEYGRLDRFFLSLYGSRGNMEYTDDKYLENYDLSHLDREEIVIGTALNKRIFSMTQLSLNFDHYEYNFANDPAKDGVGEKLSLGIKFPEIGKVTGSLRFGWKSFSPDNPLYKNFSKPFGSGDLTIRMLRRVKLQFRYLVDNFFSFWSGDEYFDERSASAGIDYYFSRKIKIGCRYDRGALSFKKLGGGIETRSDDFEITEFSIGFRLFKKMGIALTYTIYSATSSQRDFSRSYRFIGGNIIHEF
jgi:hypothetical protein